jgi:hypothetical protein
VTEILRGQQGFPTGSGRRSAGPVDDVVVAALPSRDDWERPEQAEAAVAVVRDELARSRGNRAPGATNEQADLVREAEEIEEQVAPGRTPGDDQAPTEESSND